MIKRLLLLLASSALAASASTITFSPTSQTINLGASTTVDVLISGLSANQALGAFDLFVDSNSSIISATNVSFFSNLGNPNNEITGSTLSTGSTEGAETSLESTATLLGLQGSQPFSLFEVTYTGVGVGTSLLTLASSPEYLADGAGAILAAPTVVNGSITVLGKGGMSTTPEPSSLALLASGGGVIAAMLKRRRLA